MSPYLPTTLLCFLTLLLPSVAAAQKAAGSVERFVGIWLTEDKEGAVAIYRCGKALCGKLYWLKPSDAPDAALDDKNPDPALRGRPLCGMEFMGGFTPQSDGSLSSGWIYSPRHGATFSAALKPGDDADTIELRGYFIVPMLGESQVWQRTTNLQPCSAPH